MRRALLAAVAALACAAPAQAEQRLVTIETPSAVVDARTTVDNGVDDLRANVLLPDGYDADERSRWPLLVLLHGVGDRFDAWASPERGDVARTLAGLPAVVVMPEGGRGFYTDWFNGGRRGAPAWETFYREELLPLLERRFRLREGRRWRAVAGLSMGGLGATYLAAQLPGAFGAVATFSGFVDHQRPEIGVGVQAVGGVAYEDVFGPMDGAYATGHNPTRLAENLAAHRVFVAVGDGTGQANAGGALVEAALHPQSRAFAAAARAAGAAVEERPQPGTHDWPFWRAHLRQAVAWDLFAPVAEQPARWAYRTVARRGRAWDVRFEHQEAPEAVHVLRRDGALLSGEGRGELVLRDGLGCRREAAFPFRVRLPFTACGGRRLRVAVTPARVRSGARARTLRIAVTVADDGVARPVPGARVRVGRRVLRTAGDGRARLRTRVPRGGLRITATRRGFREGTARVRRG